MLPKFQWWELSIQNISFLHEMRWSSQMVITFELCIVWHWKNNQNEENFIGFYLHYISVFRWKNPHFMAVSLVQQKNNFSQKNWKQMIIGKSIGIGKSNQHIFLSNLYPWLPSTHAWFLHTLGAPKLMSKKLWQLLWDVFHLTKNNIQFQKEDCCL